MFSSSKSNSTVATQLRVQTAIAGATIALGWGQQRLAGNLLWYGDFQSFTQSSSGGGKGGGGKAGGTTNYSCSFVLALCETPVASFVQVWADSVATSSYGPTPEAFSSLDIGGFAGGYAQTPWSYLSSVYPSQALAYRGLAYLVSAGFQLGSSAALPNLTFELQFSISGAISGYPDADPAAVITDFLTNPTYGAGFPSAYLGSLATYSNYCVANGLVVSPVITDQGEARQFITDLLAATNSAAVWSSGLLTIVPFGDTSITANGHTYAAPTTPLYSLVDVDFKAPQGSNPNSTASLSSNDPIQITRLRPSDQQNSFTVEYLDRSNSYNPTVIEAFDEAGITAYGLRRTAKTLHFFCLQSAAVMSAYLTLGREAVRNTYSFTLGAEYILLDPMDIIEITDPAMGLNQQWVRITEITENNDATLSILAEDYLAGTASAPQYQAQPALGVGPPLNASPSGLIAPVIFEPTYTLAQATEIWIAMGGSAHFGGADIWVSDDDTTYRYAGTFEGNSRVGALTAALASVAAASPGVTTIDTTDTISIDMSPTDAQLLSGTQADAQAANTLCWVNGELLAYATATLTSGSAYTLSYLARGLYDTTPQAAPSGSPLVRLSPGTFFRFPLTVDRIGQTFYFKILPFNDFGNGRPALSAVSSAAYTVQGVALAETLASPSALTTSYIGAFTYLTWTEVSDWRGPSYEVRKGAAWGSAQKVATVAHPPFLVSGDDTYWVAAVVTPSQGLTVYSAPLELVISGSTISSTIAETYDEAATSWTGTVSGGAVVAGSVVTTSGGVTSQVGGIYEIPTGHQIDVGRICACTILINWTAGGFPAASSFLAITDFLADADLLGGAAAAAMSVYPEIAISQDGSTWSAWQKYAAGAYTGRKFKARMQIQTTNPGTAAILSAFTFAVAPPERDDHYLSLSVPTGGVTISFKPDGTTTAAPFNAGPSGAVLPAIQGTILGASSGDTLIITSETLSGCTVQVLNGGSGVARTVNLLVQGS